jgi:single-strand DNA-binding protein
MMVLFIYKYSISQKGRKETGMNSVNVIGRLTKDPEMRKTEEGRSICTLRLAIDDTFSKDDRADFISVTVFGNQGDNCERYLRKGFITGVQGRIRSDTYTDSDGVKRYPIKLIAERVQFLQWPERKERAAAAEAAAALVNNEAGLTDSDADFAGSAAALAGNGNAPDDGIAALDDEFSAAAGTGAAQETEQIAV